MQNYKNSLHSLNALIKRNLIKIASLSIRIPENKNKVRLIFILFIIIPASLIVSTCSKDEENRDRELKEALTTRLIKDINADSLQSVVQWLQGMGTRFALADNHRDVAVNIKNRFIRLGYNDCRLDSFMITRVYRGINYEQWQYNVIASITGTDHPDSVCVMGAHYDSILSSGDPFSAAPGANDNASGTAATMELARVMKKNNYTPANTIEFVAFGSEELGLYGSHDYARDAFMSSKKIKFMLNNDMVSFMPSTNKEVWSVNIMDYDNSHGLRTEAETLIEKYCELNYFNNNTFNRQSDSYPFFVNGYKALFFYSGASDPFYHTLEDTAEKYNFEYCREIVKVSCALLVYNN